MSAAGDVLVPLDERRLLADSRGRPARRGLRSAAIVLLHGASYPQHEQSAERLAKLAGFEQVSVSHR